MEDKREESVEELAEKLESSLARKAEADDDGFEEIDLNDTPKGWISEEEEFPEDEWEEEETAPMKPWMIALVMAGLIVLAAVICAILWHFTHLEGGNGNRNSQISSAASGENLSPNSEAGLDGDSAAVGDNEADGSSGAAAGNGTEPTATPEATATPIATPSVTSVPAPTLAASQTTASSESQTSAAVQEPVSGTTAMEFTQSIADVTPKDVINLRSEPSTLNADNIVMQAKNGEVLSRTGVNEATGWTRIEYNGEILYAVSQYLTTDLTYRTPVQAANPNRVNTLDGRIIIFVDCSENITPKEYVNLRTEPSTSEGESTVRCQVSNGEVLHRTGYSPDAGWSRVEYNGESLYVVSSYVYTVE